VCTETLISKYNMVVGSHGHSGVWRNVIRMVAAGLIDPRKMITRKIELEEAPGWLETLRTNKEEGKVMIVL
jgi:threonine dehydrogenase-like Zn-dependent dehydrogenase